MQVFEYAVQEEDYAPLTSLNSIPGQPKSAALKTSFSIIGGENGNKILRFENLKFGNSKGQCVFVADKSAGEGGRIFVVSKSVYLDWTDLKVVELLIEPVGENDSEGKVVI